MALRDIDEEDIGLFEAYEDLFVAILAKTVRGSWADPARKPSGFLNLGQVLTVPAKRRSAAKCGDKAAQGYINTFTSLRKRLTDDYGIEL